MGLYGAPGAAQTPVCDSDEPTHCSVSLRASQPAPYDGQLLTPNLAIDLGMKAKACEERAQLKLEREKELRRIEVEALKRALDHQGKAMQEMLISSQREMERLAQGPPWYERPPFIAAVAVLGTVAALTLAVQVVEAR